MKTLNVTKTAYPNGDVDTYENGMPDLGLLPSNHPLVLAMKAKRHVNKLRKTRTLIQEASSIINITSTKLRRAK